MKSLNTARRARPLVAGLLCASVIVGFIACSGSSERRAGRNSGEGGEYESSGGSAPQSGGSLAHGGDPAITAGAASLAGAGGSSAGQPGGAGETSHGGQSSGGDTSDGAGAGGAGAGGAGAGGDANGGGQTFGGESAGGAGGEASGGNGGEGGSTDVIDPVCGLNMVQVGAYSLWCGKVNMHETVPGVWTHDADCTSGCNLNGVAYCQKFYPATTAVVTVPQSQTKDWKNANCDESGDGTGIDGEAACCAPIP